MKQDFILNTIGIETLEENKREEMRMMKDRVKNAVIKRRYMCSIGEEENLSLIHTLHIILKSNPCQQK